MRERFIIKEASATTNITGSLEGFAGTLQVDAGTMTLGTDTQTLPNLNHATVNLNGGTLRMLYKSGTLNLSGISGTGTLSLVNSEVTVGTLQNVLLQADGATVTLPEVLCFSTNSVNGGRFVLPSSTLKVSDNVVLNGDFSVGGDLTVRPEGYTMTLDTGVTLADTRNLVVASQGTVVLAGAKSLSGNVNVETGAVKLTGDVDVLPDSAVINLGRKNGRGTLLAAGTNQTVSTVNLTGKSAKIQSESGSLVVGTVNRQAQDTLLVQKNTGGNTLDLTAGTGFTMVGTAGNEILPGVSYVTGTNTASGNFAMLSDGKIVSATNYVNMNTYYTNNPDFAVSELADKVIFNNWSWKNGDVYRKEVGVDMTVNALLTQSDFVITNGATLTLSSGTLIMQGGGHWIQGNGKITSSYSSDGGATNDLYLFSNGSTTSDLRLRNVAICNRGTTPVNVWKDGEGIVKLATANTYTGETEVRAGILREAASNQTSGYRVLDGGTLEMRVNNTQNIAVAQGGLVSLQTVSGTPTLSTFGNLGGTVRFSQYLDENNTATTIASTTSTPTFTGGGTFETMVIDGVNAEKTVTVNFNGAQTARTKTFTTSGIANFNNGFTLAAEKLDILAGSTTFAAGSTFTGGVSAASDTLSIASDNFNVTGDSAFNGNVSLSGTVKVKNGATLTLADAENTAAAPGNIHLENGTLFLAYTDLDTEFIAGELGLSPNSMITVDFSGWVGAESEIFSSNDGDFRIFVSEDGARLSDTLAYWFTGAVMDPTAHTMTWHADGAKLPEPASWVLLLGTLGLCLRRKK